MSEFTIKQIFQDNWDNFVLDNTNISIRAVVFVLVVANLFSLI